MFHFLFRDLEHTWSHPSTQWPALYLLCLHPILWLSRSVQTCAMPIYLHPCMLNLLLWIMEWHGLTLVCCESLLSLSILFLFHRRKIFMHDALSVWSTTRPFVWENDIPQLMVPTCCRFYFSSVGFGIMHWKFFHIVIVLVWLKQVDFSSNQQTEEKEFRNSIFVNVWMNTGKIISKYELDLCVYARVCMWVHLKACVRQKSINCHDLSKQFLCFMQK